jgi:hypothetical protein
MVVCLNGFFKYLTARVGSFFRLYAIIFFKGENIMEYIQMLLAGAVSLLSGFAANHPVVASILMGVGMARAIFKPLFTFLHAIADVTPSPKDNELLVKAENSKVYSIFSFILDYVASIKLPAKK